MFQQAEMMGFVRMLVHPTMMRRAKRQRAVEVKIVAATGTRLDLMAFQTAPTDTCEPVEGADTTTVTFTGHRYDGGALGSFGAALN